MHRFRFFGREAVSLLLVLPLALPGIITGIALQVVLQLHRDQPVAADDHHRPRDVLHRRRLQQRHRPAAPDVRRRSYEASADLGAHGFQTFRSVTLPMLSTALVSGALLAFALSFDEVIVTTFTAGAQNTLPLWIFGAIRLGQQLPEVNVVVVAVLLLTIIPVAIAVRLTGGGGVTRGSAAGGGTPRCLTPAPDPSAHPWCLIPGRSTAASVATR